MTGTIIQFPTYEERDALEFDWRGTSSYTRANEEAAALLPAMRTSRDRPSLAGRAVALTRLIRHVAVGRPEMVEEFVLLDDGGMIELRAVPAELDALLAGA